MEGEGIIKLVILIFIVFGVLQIILFFKIWGMTDDIRKIKEKYINSGKASKNERINKPEVDKSNIDTTYTGKFKVKDNVIEIATGKRMHIKNIKNNGQYACFINEKDGTIYYYGDFYESEIKYAD